jgi:hypothetical protein
MLRSFNNFFDFILHSNHSSRNLSGVQKIYMQKESLSYSNGIAYFIAATILIIVCNCQTFNSTNCYGQIFGNYADRYIVNAPVLDGAKICLVKTATTGEQYVIEIAITSASVFQTFNYIGQSFNWDGERKFDSFNPKEYSCHCPWGKFNWKIGCDQSGLLPGLNPVNVTSDVHGNKRATSGKFCMVSGMSVPSSGCAFSSYTTAAMVKHVIDMQPRDLYLAEGDSEFLIFASVMVYNYTTNALITDFGQISLSSTAAQALSFGTFFTVNLQDIVKVPFYDFENRYVSYNGNIRDQKHLVLIPNQYIDAGGASLDKVGNVMLTRQGARYQLPTIESRLTKSVSSHRCHGSSATSYYDMGSQLAFEEDKTFNLSNIHQIDYYSDDGLNMILGADAQTDIQLGIVSSGGTLADLVWIQNTIPTLTLYQCSERNQYFDTVTCTLNYIISQTNLISIGANTVLGIEDVLFTAPSGTVEITIPSNLFQNDILSICVSPIYGSGVQPVCYVLRSTLIIEEDLPLEHPEDDEMSDEIGLEEQDKGEEVGDAYSTLSWYWILLIVVICLLVTLFVVLVMRKMCMAKMKGMVEAYKNWREYKMVNKEAEDIERQEKTRERKEAIEKRKLMSDTKSTKNERIV